VVIDRLIVDTMGEWQYGLFGCFDNFMVCVITFFCPCYTAGRVAETTGRSCVLHSLLTFVPVAHVVCPCMVRGDIRLSKNIPGLPVVDCLTHLFCKPCALCQEAVETGALSSSAMAAGGLVMERI